MVHHPSQGIQGCWPFFGGIGKVRAFKDVSLSSESSLESWRLKFASLLWSIIEVVRDPPGVKSHLKPLCHFHLPSRYPDTLTQPSVTLGATLRAQNQPEMHPTQPHFPLSMPKVVSMRPSGSKIASKTSVISTYPVGILTGFPYHFSIWILMKCSI